MLLKNVKHPFLVGLHYSFQTTEKLYFVLDFVNGGEVRDAAFGSESFCLLIPGGRDEMVLYHGCGRCCPRFEGAVIPCFTTDCHSLWTLFLFLSTALPSNLFLVVRYKYCTGIYS